MLIINWKKNLKKIKKITKNKIIITIMIIKKNKKIIIYKK
jgi:hypothetical protein